MRRILGWGWCIVLALGACRDLAIPAPPGPSSIQGRVVYVSPGASTLKPAVGAVVELRGTSLLTVVTDEDGRFVLPNGNVTQGTLLFSFDADKDGRADRQRLLNLESLHAAPGRDIALGDVVIGKNARLSGLVRGVDQAERSTGHSGTSVVIEGTGFFGFTGDSGAFTLDELPEGELRVSMFRSGYAPESVALTLRAGEDVRLRDVLLERSGDLRPAAVRGTVNGVEGEGLSGATVRAAAGGQDWLVRTDGAGAYAFDSLPPGVVAFSFEKEGFVTVVLRGALVLPGANTLSPVVLAVGTSVPMPLDGGPTPLDAGPDDAGSLDAGLIDAGERDAGVDAGELDASTPMDAGTDGGSTDAGPDAGAVDAGPTLLTLPEGSLLLTDGTVLLPDGGLLLRDGGVGTFDGGTLGGITLPAGAVVLADGSIRLADGRIVLPGGVVVLLDGGLQFVSGSTDGGAVLDCRGACASGFGCSAALECQTGACALQSCAGACQNGRCYADRCSMSGPACSPGDVCDGTSCTPMLCAGVVCSSGYRCAAGRCLPTSCALGACGNADVCIGGSCTNARCVDVTCPANTLCVTGMCLPTQSGSLVCPAGSVFVGGRCVDPTCENVTCAAGTSCRRGACVSSGLIVAGIVYPIGQTFQPLITAIAESTPQGWKKLNVSTLPRIKLLQTSPDGTWLYALGDDGVLRRSGDGVVWTTIWSGQFNVTGAMETFSVHPTTGEIVVAINSGNFNQFGRFEHSVDNGATFSTMFTPPRGLVQPNNYGTAPGLVSYFEPNFGDELRGIMRTDGGLLLATLPAWGPGQLAFDPTGWGPTLYTGAQLRFLDGGISGSFQTCAACVVYGAAPSLRINALTTNAVWKSVDFGQSWGARSITTPATLDLSSIAVGADGTLYAGNRNGFPPLIASSDEGETWSPAAEDMSSNAGLADPWPEWAPNTPFSGGNNVQPHTLNGHLYTRIAGNAPNTGLSEPNWPIDGGLVTEPGADVVWQDRGLINPLRVTAMTTRVCGIGRMRCNGTCVDVGTSTQHCGACNAACSGSCLSGRCNDVDAGVFATPGCADGTREGLVDTSRYPDIVACAGRWPGDLTDVGADSLCAAGWHVCRHDDTEPRVVSFAEASGFAGCFAYRASNDDFDGCEPLVCQGDVRHDDMAGMGRDCRLTAGASWPSVSDGGTCLAGRGRIDAQCCAISVALPGQTRAPGCRQRAETGVVCCRN